MEKMRVLLLLAAFFIANSVFSQSKELAKNYFDQGEYEKALSTYKKLYERAAGNTTYFYGIINSLQELERYDEAEKRLLEKLASTSNSPNFLIDLGYNHQLKENQEEAERFYAEALKAIEVRPNYAYMVARSFQKYTLLEYAIAAYEAGMEMNEDVNYNIQLAKLYGEMGQMEKMFESYLNLLEDNPNYFHIVNRYFSQFLSDDPSDEVNIIFRNQLLKKLQSTPDVQFNEMLSWLFIQQNEFKKAFLQEKAIYRRKKQGLGNMFDLAIMSRKASDFETAQEILKFIIEESTNNEIIIEAQQERLDLQIAISDSSAFEEIENQFQELFNNYGRGRETLALQIDYANFLAFRNEQKEKAISHLKNLLNLKTTRFEEAAIKMALADILVLDEKFNQALIYYSQVQNMVKNDVIAQNARFKVAKTSYYKGDFNWAKTQLDVLKSSTSQLIANDAMELSLLISDNSQEDSTQTALKIFAKADLFAFQNKNDQAITLLEQIIKEHEGEKIIDEALFRLGNLFYTQKQYKKAEEAYIRIIESFPEEILADDAYFALAGLYEDLNQAEKAKENYEQIIFNHPDSIYFVDARKRYRSLRGDSIK